jgi:AraC-like DNA-binding protein
VTAHGILGLALLSAKNLEAVLNVLVRYSDIALPNLRVNVTEKGEQTHIAFAIHSPFADFNTSLAETLAVNIYRSLNFLAGQEIPLKAMDFAHAEPPYREQYAEHFSCDISFNRDMNCIYLPRAALQLPVITANELNFRLMVQQCDIELENIYSRENIVDRIKGMLATDLENGPSIGSIASRLSVSERTLRRRLSKEAVCFRDLIKSVRHDMAIHYLRDRHYRIEEIATKTGYQDSASFRNAFKKQTGLSPQNWRKRLRSAE